jgi:outer membrane protein assembly factor BamB
MRRRELIGAVTVGVGSAGCLGMFDDSADGQSNGDNQSTNQTDDGGSDIGDETEFERIDNRVAGEWPQSDADSKNTRSITADGPETAPADEWAFTDIPESPATPVVSDSLVYLPNPNQQSLLLIEAATGEMYRRHENTGLTAPRQMSVVDGATYLQQTERNGGTGTRAQVNRLNSHRLGSGPDSHTGLLVRVDPVTLDEKWTAPVSGDFLGTTVHDGSVYVTAPSYITALDAADGRERWRYETPSSLSPRFVSVGSDIIGFAVDRNLFGLNPDTGEQLWNHQFGPSTRFPYVLLNDQQFLAAFGDTVHAVGLDGEIRWEQTPAADEDISTLALGDETLYVGSREDWVVALDTETGTELWRETIDGLSYSLRTTVSGDTLYVDTDNAIRAYTGADGTHRWTYSFEETILTWPVVLPGLLVVVTGSLVSGRPKPQTIHGVRL